VDQGELREPEAGPLEHLQGLFSHVFSGHRKGVRVAGPAVSRVLESLCERHFQREVEVISATFLISPEAIQPTSAIQR
jgi:hypothetical protein